MCSSGRVPALTVNRQRLGSRAVLTRQRFQPSTNPSFRARCITTQTDSNNAAILSHHLSHHVRHEPSLPCPRPECAGAESSPSPCAPDILVPVPYFTRSSSSSSPRVPHQRSANRARHVPRRVDIPGSPSPRWHRHPHMAAPAHGHHVRLRRNGLG
jgi:hypothetical protein